MRALNASVMMVLVGCTGGVEFEGQNIPNYFEFQNNLETRWEYANEDETLNYRLVGTITDFLTVDGSTEYTTTWRSDCIGANDPDCADDQIIRELTMTADFLGVRILEVDGNRLDTPIQLADQFMKVGDQTSSTSAGSTFTSTYVETAQVCPVLIVNWNQCPVFELAGSPANPAVDGQYAIAADFNLVMMDWADQPGRWMLTNAVPVQ
jgi:hypothetical protein